MDEQNKQLFVIGSDIINTVDIKTLNATGEALVEAGLWHPPYEEFDIQITGSSHKLLLLQAPALILKYNLKDIIGEDVIITDCYRYKTRPASNEYNFEYCYLYKDKKTENFIDEDEIYDNAIIDGFDDTRAKATVSYMDKCASNYLALLIVLLATKNVVKKTEEIKKYSTKSRKRQKAYKYVTTINIGKITETLRLNGATGSTVRPHLRRGHIRNQHFGEGNKEIKKIFIQPVFVNADEGWIENQRKAYVVKAA